MSVATVPCPECPGPGSNCMRCEGEGFVEARARPINLDLRRGIERAIARLAAWQHRDNADHDVACCDCSCCDNERRAAASHHPEN